MDYPCLYYLSTQLTLEDQCRFLCGLGTIFEQTPESIANCSVLYAHISHGVLYDNVGFDKAYIENIGKDFFAKPFKDCKTLCNCTFVRKSKLKQNACTYCKLSYTYLNNRLDDERTCLRYTLFTGKMCILEPTTFLSVVPLAPGNDISVYPLITFNKYLFTYLSKNEWSGPINQRELTASLSSFISSQLSYNDERSKDIVSTCVQRELSLLYAADQSSLSETLINTCQLRLINAYSYTPPLITKASSTEGLELLEKKKKKSPTNIPNQINLLDITPCEPSKVSTPLNFDDQKIDTHNNDDIDLSLVLQLSEEELENEDEFIKQLTPADNKDLISIATEESIFIGNELEIDANTNVNVENTEESITIILEDFNEANLPLRLCDDCVTNMCLHDDKMSNVFNTCFEYNKCSLLYPHYEPRTSFKRTIINCGIDDSNVIHQFLYDSCNSTVIGIEAMCMNKRNGLLFFMYTSNKFYFFDVNFALSGFLLPMLGKANKIKYLSLNSIPVVSMLKKLGFEHVRIESLSTLYATVYGLHYNTSFNKIFKEVLNMSFTSTCDFYEYAIPLYKDLYEVLVSSKSGTEDYILKTQYDKNLLINEVLGSNYDLSYVVNDLEMAIHGLNYLDYQMLFDNEMTIIRKGIMYVITFPNMKKYNENDIIEYLHTVCCKVYRSPFKCVSDTYLLSIFRDGLAYFSPGEGDIFIDILLDVARKCYRNMFNEMPIIQTHRIEYN